MLLEKWTEGRRQCTMPLLTWKKHTTGYPGSNYYNYEGAGRLKLRQGDQKSLHNIKDIHMVILKMQNNKKSAPVLVTASSHFPSLDLKDIDA